MSIKILLDTDIDILGDIDDALCLGYLLQQPACQLVGITTVTYDTEQRARVASALCRAAGKEIPIFPGARAPLLADLPQIDGPDTSAAEAEILRRWPHEQRFPRNAAVAFMRQTIHEYPHDVTLLAIGPLTNVALLFATDPETPSLLKGFVTMCGAFNGQGSRRAEWNAGWDPHATAMVYRAPVNSHRSVGLDVTEQINLDAAGFWRRFKAAPSHPIHDFAAHWFRHRPAITFHDPLTAAAIFDDQICSWERGLVEVEMEGTASRGVTRWTPSEAHAPHEIAIDVDRGHFLDHFFGVLAEGKLRR